MSLRNPHAEVEEVIPTKLMFEKTSQSSLVTSTDIVQAVPTSGGTTYGPGGARDCVFKINSQHFLDLSDLSLMFQLSTSHAYLIFDDLAPASVIQRIQLRINDVVVDDISDVATLVRTMTYLTCPKQYYEGQLHSMAGAAKYCKSFRRQVPAGGGDADQHSSNGYTMQSHDAPIYADENIHHSTHPQNNKNTYCLPLNFLSVSRGYQGQVKLWPARFAGNIELVVTFADWQDACVVMSDSLQTATHTFNHGVITNRTKPGTGPNDYAITNGYEVKNPKLIFKSVELLPEYYSQFDSVIMDDAGDGIKWYHNQYKVINKQITQGVHNTSHDISVRISAYDLRTLFVCFFPKFLNKEFYTKQSYFGDIFKKAYLTCGTKTIPSNHVNNTMEAFWNLRDALGDMNITTAGGLIDFDGYRGRSRRMTPASDGTAFATRGREHLERVTHNRDRSVLDPFSDPETYFVLGFNLSKEMGDSEATEALGLNTVASAGQVITLHVEFEERQAGVTNTVSYNVADHECEVTFIADCAKHIKLHKGAVSLSI